MCVCVFICVWGFGFYCGRSVNRDFVGLLGNDGVIKVHFEEWWGEKMLRAKRRRSGGG